MIGNFKKRNSKKGGGIRNAVGGAGLIQEEIGGGRQYRLKNKKEGNDSRGAEEKTPEKARENK